MKHWLTSNENVGYLESELPRLKNTVRIDHCEEGMDI